MISLLADYKSLSTYYDKFITFALEGENYVINVEDLGKNQEKDRVSLHYYTSPRPAGGEPNGYRPVVNISPTKYNGLLLYANEKQCSVKLQKSEQQPPDQASFFYLHAESSEFVSFECKNKSGTFLGVKDNHLALVERTYSGIENTLFKLLE
ncbi:interleukin-33 [Ochotona curzoniae]|uniref:interleukin-33 n=1 Tax=Ochotona curzoniae TaxID=130825 RepID=UPI001B3512F2|nr:interleukin-33 [Ochotona curzoniae]